MKIVYEFSWKIVLFCVFFSKSFLECDFLTEWSVDKCLKSALKSTDKERYQIFFSEFPTKSNSLIPNLGVRGHEIYCINIFAKLSSPYLWVMTRFWENIFFHGWVLMKFTWKLFPGYPLSHRSFFGNSFRDLPIWVRIPYPSEIELSTWKYGIVHKRGHYVF